MDQQSDNPVAIIQEEKTIVLRNPVILGDVTYAEINLREPTAGELSKANKAGDSYDMAIVLVSLIGKVPRGVVERLCQRDFQECNDFLGGFTFAGPATGEM